MQLSEAFYWIWWTVVPRKGRIGSSPFITTQASPAWTHNCNLSLAKSRVELVWDGLKCVNLKISWALIRRIHTFFISFPPYFFYCLFIGIIGKKVVFVPLWPISCLVRWLVGWFVGWLVGWVKRQLAAALIGPGGRASEWSEWLGWMMEQWEKKSRASNSLALARFVISFPINCTSFAVLHSLRPSPLAVFRSNKGRA